MKKSGLDTGTMLECVQRIREGDLRARDELLRGVSARVEKLARRMLKKFPRVRHWEETMDVLQMSLLRLLQSLQKVDPPSMRAFYGLAAAQIRRVLLDLVRHYYGPSGHGTNHSREVIEDIASNDESEELAKWAMFHEEVERLPVIEREIVNLIFYHGWTQADIAEFLELSVHSVKRHWKSARLRLYDVVKGEGGRLPMCEPEKAE